MSTNWRHCWKIASWEEGRTSSSPSSCSLPLASGNNPSAFCPFPLHLCHLWSQLTEDREALTVSQPSFDTILLYPKDDICFLNADLGIMSYFPFTPYSFNTSTHEICMVNVPCAVFRDGSCISLLTLSYSCTSRKMNCMAERKSKDAGHRKDRLHSIAAVTQCQRQPQWMGYESADGDSPGRSVQGANREHVYRWKHSGHKTSTKENIKMFVLLSLLLG